MAQARIALPILLALAPAVGWAQSSVPDVSRQLRDFEDCMLARAIELDDGHSDARSVAAALVLRCANTRRALAAAAMSGQSEREIALLIEATRDISLDRGTTIVLGLRADRRKP